MTVSLRFTVKVQFLSPLNDLNKGDNIMDSFFVWTFNDVFGLGLLGFLLVIALIVWLISLYVPFYLIANHDTIRT